MKSIITLCILLYGINNVQAQSYQTEEIRIRYSDGIEVFNICKNNPTQYYNEEKEYFWYTEFSNIKSTKGGSGGQLLHGNYKLYDQEGSLCIDKNYHLGLQHGKKKTWDSIGNISSKTTYDKGKIVYWKFKNDEDYWVEFNGELFKEGSNRKVYNKYGDLVEERHTLSDFKEQINIYYEIYYENSGNLKEKFTCFVGFSKYGKFTAYYENGNIEISGQYIDAPFSDIRIGTWKWFKQDGILESEEKYKAESEYWPDGEKKFAGGFILNESNEEWLKTGKWMWWDDEGKLLTEKEFNWGVEVDK